MKLLHLLCLIGLAVQTIGLQKAEDLQVTGNPHIAPKPLDAATAGGQCWGSAGGCPAENIEPSALAAAPKVGELATQVETLSSIISVKYLGMDVPIYRFKQPSRLNPAELPFKITLVRDIDPYGIRVLSVPEKQAADSWFLGYSWEVVVCEGCGDVTHLGWKFTKNGLSGAASNIDYFYALIVDYNKKKEQAAEGVYGDAEAVGASIVDLVSGPLSVGMRGPAWVLSLLGSGGRS